MKISRVVPLIILALVAGCTSQTPKTPDATASPIVTNVYPADYLAERGIYVDHGVYPLDPIFPEAADQYRQVSPDGKITTLQFTVINPYSDGPAALTPVRLDLPTAGILTHLCSEGCLPTIMLMPSPLAMSTVLYSVPGLDKPPLFVEQPFSLTQQQAIEKFTQTSVYDLINMYVNVVEVTAPN